MHSDTQIVEIVGRNWLVTELYRSGLEIAHPERDHGIDLIAYVDLDESGRFIGRPIQLKASSERSFGIWRKLEKFPDLLIAYVWNTGDLSRAICYCLTYQEAQGIADQMGWTKTGSWTEGGVYITTAPSDRLLNLLEEFKMTPEKWRTKVRSPRSGGAES